MFGFVVLNCVVLRINYVLLKINFGVSRIIYVLEI